jgi:hypothetical protein
VRLPAEPNFLSPPETVNTAPRDPAAASSPIRIPLVCTPGVVESHVERAEELDDIAAILVQRQ